MGEEEAGSQQSREPDAGLDHPEPKADAYDCATKAPQDSRNILADKVTGLGE